MMNRIDEFDAVCITDLDRFGRSLKHLTTWYNDLTNRGIDLVILNRSIDTSTHEGELQLHMLMVIAVYER